MRTSAVLFLASASALGSAAAYAVRGAAPTTARTRTAVSMCAPRSKPEEDPNIPAEPTLGEWINNMPFASTLGLGLERKDRRDAPLASLLARLC